MNDGNTWEGGFDDEMSFWLYEKRDELEEIRELGNKLEDEAYEYNS